MILDIVFYKLWLNNVEIYWIKLSYNLFSISLKDILVTTIIHLADHLIYRLINSKLVCYKVIQN